jgi:hypothetical protein
MDGNVEHGPRQTGGKRKERMDTTKRAPAPEKPVKRDDSTVATRGEKRDDRDSDHWVDRPDWHGAGVVGENHTD